MSGIYDITPFSLLDFPGIPAAILWFSGCNLRCGYCYNPDIVLGKGRISEEQILNILRKRIGLLEGVVLSGGEATLYPRIIDFAREIRQLGYRIKLDTNAMTPHILAKLLDEKLIDYVALDYKAPQEKMESVCERGEEALFWDSFDLLRTYGVDFEVRTTFHPDLLNEIDISKMAFALHHRGYEAPFYVQPFRNNVPTLGNLASSEFSMNMKLLPEWVEIRN